MYKVVILYFFVLAKEKHNCNVEGGEGDHLEVDSLPEDTENHQEDYDQVTGVFVFFGDGEVMVAESVDQQHPLVQKL